MISLTTAPEIRCRWRETMSRRSEEAFRQCRNIGKPVSSARSNWRSKYLRKYT